MNQMIGGTMLALPILYTKVGILAGVMIFLILGTISMKTNLIYVDHNLPHEIDT
jgi:amino acid permease